MSSTTGIEAVSGTCAGAAQPGVLVSGNARRSRVLAGAHRGIADTVTQGQQHPIDALKDQISGEVKISTSRLSSGRR